MTVHPTKGQMPCKVNIVYQKNAMIGKLWISLTILCKEHVLIVKIIQEEYRNTNCVETNVMIDRKYWLMEHAKTASHTIYLNL